jgi:heme/copper-type cytochrome/quinol oxidase subunit 2
MSRLRGGIGLAFASLGAWPATRTLLCLKDASSPDLTIKVTGYQWKWGYDYLKREGRGHFLPVQSRHAPGTDHRQGAAGRALSPGGG